MAESGLKRGYNSNRTTHLVVGGISCIALLVACSALGISPGCGENGKSGPLDTGDQADTPGDVKISTYAPPPPGATVQAALETFEAGIQAAPHQGWFAVDACIGVQIGGDPKSTLIIARPEGLTTSDDAGYFGGVNSMPKSERGGLAPDDLATKEAFAATVVEGHPYVAVPMPGAKEKNFEAGWPVQVYPTQGEYEGLGYQLEAQKMLDSSGPQQIDGLPLAVSWQTNIPFATIQQHPDVLAYECSKVPTDVMS